MVLEEFSKAAQALCDIKISFQLDHLHVSVDFINVQKFDMISGFDDHSHSNHEFHYIKSGKGEVILSGKRFSLEKGMFYLTGPGVVHRQTSDPTHPMVEYALKCTISLIPVINSLENEENQYLLDILANKSFEAVYDMNNMERSFEAIFEEIWQKRPGYFNQIKNHIIQLINSSARNLCGQTQSEYRIPHHSLSRHRLSIIESYILDNLKRNISCRELANYIFLSEKQLNRIVLDLTGLPTHRFIMDYRLKAAKALLEKGNMPLKAIADTTGFSNEFHLSRCFKKYTGLPPREYRKQS